MDLLARRKRTKKSYPEGVNVNFRRVDRSSLLRYVAYHGVRGVYDGISHEDLAIAVACHFKAWDIFEDDSVAVARRRGAGKRKGKGKGPPPPRTTSPRLRTRDQVAAYVGPGSDVDAKKMWILARFVRVMGQGRVKVTDEDNASNEFELPLTDIVRLRDTSSNVNKGDNVMAVFPDSTTFYPATVARHTAGSKTVAVKFREDDDDSGEPRVRRVPVEHVFIEDGHAHRGSRPNENGNGHGSNQGNPSVTSSSSLGKRSRAPSPSTTAGPHGKRFAAGRGDGSARSSQEGGVTSRGTGGDPLRSGSGGKGGVDGRRNGGKRRREGTNSEG